MAMPWLSDDDLQASRLPPLAPGCGPDSLDAAGPIQIAGVSDGVALRSPSQADRTLHVTVRALGTLSSVSWLLDGRLVGTTTADEPVQVALPDPGDHRITAVADNGPFARVQVRVLPPAGGSRMASAASQ
jgi:penicillin-binding protein 1C